MTTNRVLLSSARTSISNPGIDVLSPPTLTRNHLLFDSSFTDLENIVIASNFIFNTPATAFQTNGIAFTPQINAPFVYLCAANAAAYKTYDDNFQVSGEDHQNVFRTILNKNAGGLWANFTIDTAPFNQPGAWNAQSRDWLYIVLAWKDVP